MSGNRLVHRDATDRRARRTRRALLQAFNRLALSRRYEDIRVADIVREADVGRSTFYDHYPGRDAIHLDALRRPLDLLAAAVTGDAEADALIRLAEHFWENRALARATFAGPQRPQIARLLADLIAGRLDADAPDARLRAVQLAEGQLGLLRAWTAGEVTASPETLAGAILEASQVSTNTVGD
ncbi:TetR/AcrR family transcriptional regulator [Marinicauda salina]|nr:TetR/AcrR family transcriptional regulator [Marinicauda salina]